MAGVWAHPQLLARRRWTTVPTEAGAVPALLPPGANGADQPRMDAVPALGQHTDALLASLGYDTDQIAQLRVQGAV